MCYGLKIVSSHVKKSIVSRNSLFNRFGSSSERRFLPGELLVQRVPTISCCSVNAMLVMAILLYTLAAAFSPTLITEKSYYISAIRFDSQRRQEIYHRLNSIVGKSPVSCGGCLT